MLNTTATFRPSHGLVPASTGRLAAAVCIALTAFTSMAAAQNAALASGSADAQCVLAGRVNSEQRWAPQARGIELLDAQGTRITLADKTALANVKQVRISSPALLSACNGDQALAKGDDLPSWKKTSSPAVSPGAAPVPVQAVGFPPLRVGGSLVELRLSVPADRTVALTR
jgi:hypothetical protein